MEFDGFDWDDGNIKKCQKHGVSIAEIESLFFGSPLVGPDIGHSDKEQRLRAAGRTAQKRSVFVVFTMRSRDGKVLIRPVSARYMHSKEVKTYEKEISRLKD
jgi:uncharacterized DUF497 family protein